MVHIIKNGKSREVLCTGAHVAKDDYGLTHLGLVLAGSKGGTEVVRLDAQTVTYLLRELKAHKLLTAEYLDNL
jgi:hypothetical protein